MLRRLVILATLLLPFVLQASEPLREPSLETGIGIWYQPDAPQTSSLWREGDAGTRLLLRARVVDRRSRPVTGARVELWHADAASVVHADRFRATLYTDERGAFRVSTVYPGYVWGPRHIHVVITHPAHPQFISRLFFRRDPKLAELGPHGVPVFLEDGEVEGEPALFGRVEVVLRRQ